MNKRIISVTRQGRISQSLLAKSGKGVFSGFTSRGTFLKLDSDWVLFLSFESFRGPLTVNLSGEASTLNGVGAGSLVEIQGGKIHNISNGIEIDFSRSQTWEAPPSALTWLSPVERVRLLKEVFGLVSSQQGETGLYRVLGTLLDLEFGEAILPPRPFERIDFAQLLRLLKTNDLDELLLVLTPLLGLGAGLTPAVDDMVLGLVLAYRRWGSVLSPSNDLTRFNDRLVQVAYQKTTLLSANLIACAAQGQADERLITGLDGMMTGVTTPEQCALSLSSWGKSSGSDALVGMALAILSAQA